MNNHHQSGMSRRGFCLCCIGGAAFAATGAWLTPAEVFAAAGNIVDMIRDEAAKAQINTRKLKGGVNVLSGSGGNIAVLTGDDGKVLVDAGITATRPRIEKALADLGDQPITHLINTHWHFDHTDGNEWLHSEGAEIIAQQNTLTHLSSAQRVQDWDFNFPASPPAALPTALMNSERTLKWNGATIILKHYDPAHTDGDISVTFEEADVLHTGDTFWNGIYPFIDYSTGGNIDGMIKAAAANVKATTSKTVVIPGHGPVGNHKQLVAFHDMLAHSRDNVAKLKKQGRSLEEVVAAKPTSRYDATWGKFVITPRFFTQLIYEGV
ncbi:MBL fold metallo-hydrolase [Neorhizobium sp. P12A]|uniref:MBL fold metallo-hydrolase n=1 Tax=Neorhizobium sp. P12A TaxID=2268027 RepID=UPI0011EEA64D|nr:MBL fold metallo-hydrolase [Neorhizobium sp. P12A]KAA0697458.1 MBL fold metallo-hydrolase [Neorhizobium sp. P12A]